MNDIERSDTMPLGGLRQLEQVAQFHRAFKNPIVALPAIPDESRCQLRLSLLEEELEELRSAVRGKDIVAVADALCDLQYVLCGAVLEFGLGEKFTALFDEVQSSNMSKACHSEQEAQQTVDHYATKGVASYFVQSGEKWIVYRKEDNKTLKSIRYSPANLASLLPDPVAAPTGND